MRSEIYGSKCWTQEASGSTSELEQRTSMDVGSETFPGLWLRCELKCAAPKASQVVSGRDTSLVDRP